MKERLFRARYGITLAILGFGCAYVLNNNIEAFTGLPVLVQGLFVITVIATGLFFVWKDRNNLALKNSSNEVK
jgi:hypothetical protein